MGTKYPHIVLALHELASDNGIGDGSGNHTAYFGAWCKMLWARVPVETLAKCESVLSIIAKATNMHDTQWWHAKTQTRCYVSADFEAIALNLSTNDDYDDTPISKYFTKHGIAADGMQAFDTVMGLAFDISPNMWYHSNVYIAMQKYVTIGQIRLLTDNVNCFDIQIIIDITGHDQQGCQYDMLCTTYGQALTVYGSISDDTTIADLLTIGFILL